MILDFDSISEKTEDSKTQKNAIGPFKISRPSSKITPPTNPLTFLGKGEASNVNNPTATKTDQSTKKCAHFSLKCD